ncbi:MAG: hypothetical protein FWG57_04300 [Endomicrobia bacterium]|nr:hypothetical protein [Endomicrobiia bacterium]
MSTSKNSSEIVAAIRANADKVISIAREQLGQELNFDEQAVRWLDGFIQRQYKDADPAIRNGLINMLGSFLGECIIRNFGGEWVCVDGSWGIRFDDKSAVFPFAKVGKMLENGSDDSVLGLYTLIPILFPSVSNRN